MSDFMGRTRSNRQCPPPPCPNPTPWLVFPHEFKSKFRPKTVEKQTFCTTTPSPPNNKFYLKSIPELQGKSALGCYHGWLLLIDRHRAHNDICKLSLWNPASFQGLSLPPLPNEPEDDICASVLTCPPEEEGSFILLFSRDQAAVCKPGDPAWVVQTPRIEGWNDHLYFADVTVCNGILYGRSYGFALRDSTVIIEIVSDGSNTRLHFRSPGRVAINSHYRFSPRIITSMAECCGEVYLIKLYLDMGYGKRVVGGQAWRLDVAQMAWIEVKRLKGHVFFRCNHYCISCHVESDAGGLYFVLPEDRTLYFYRVEDASLTAVLPCANLKTPWLDPFWVLPRYPRSTTEVEKHSIEGYGNEKKLDNLNDCEAHESMDACQAENQTKDIVFSKLPLNLITVIAEYLPLFDYLDLRFASKELHSAIPPIQCRSTTSSKVRNHPSSPPLFMLLRNYRDHMGAKDDGDPFSWDVIDPGRPDTKYPMSIPKSFEGAMITFSSNGWLLACRNEDSLQFLNPFTRMSRKSPLYDQLSSVSAIGFSSTPISPDCKIVGMDDFGVNEVCIWYVQYGDETWNLCTFPLHRDGFGFSHGSSCPIYHDGAFYFLDKKGYLGVFELQLEEASWRVFDERVPTQSLSFHLSRIVECDGQIAAVVVGHMGEWVDVFRWNPRAEGWHKMESLGDQTIFINPRSCFASQARRPEMENKIYFPRFYNGHLVFYSMETKKWHSNGSVEPLDDLHGTKEFLNCSWIEPSWSD